MLRRLIARASLFCALFAAQGFFGGLASPSAGQDVAAKQYQIRIRTDAFIKSHALAADPKDEALVKAQKARLASALDEMMHRTRAFLRDDAETDRLLACGMRVLDAELDYYAGKAERISVLERHLEISRELALIVEERAKVDLASSSQEEFARYCRSTIEVALLKARRDATH